MDSEVIYNPKKITDWLTDWLTHSVNNIGLRDASASKKTPQCKSRTFREFLVLRGEKLAVAVNCNLAFPDVVFLSTMIVFLSTMISKSKLLSLYSYIRPVVVAFTGKSRAAKVQSIHIWCFFQSLHASPHDFSRAFVTSSWFFSEPSCLPHDFFQSLRAPSHIFFRAFVPPLMTGSGQSRTGTMRWVQSEQIQYLGVKALFSLVQSWADWWNLLQPGVFLSNWCTQ